MTEYTGIKVIEIHVDNFGKIIYTWDTISEEEIAKAMKNWRPGAIYGE